MPSQATPSALRPYWSFAAAPASVAWLIGGVTLARLLFIAFFCTYTLAEDEAFYWDWSRHPDLSYYTKGPGVAWAIAASTRLFGHTEFAVRLPAILSAAVLSLATAHFTRDLVTDDTKDPVQGRRAGFFAAVCTLLLPMFQASALLMTIDGPYAACWAVACFLGYRALVRRRHALWPLAALAIGLSFLFKYTALVLPASWLLALLFSKPLRASAKASWPWLVFASIIFLITISPVLIWNTREGWPTIAHLLGHLGVKGGDVAPTQSTSWHYSPLWTLSYLGGQFALAGPVFALALIAAWRTRTTAAVGARFALWSGAPLFIMYLAVSVLTEPEGNWTFAGHIPACALAATLIDPALTAWRSRVLAWRALPKPRPREGFLFARPATAIQCLWHSALIIGVTVAIATVGLAPIDAAWRALTHTDRSPIPIGRFTGADTLAAHAAQLASELQSSTGQPPFFCALHYGRAAQLAFYLPNQPHVVCASSTVAGGRRTQYDYWPETRLDHPALIGRPAVLIGATQQDWLPLFSHVSDPITLRADTKRGRPAFKATNFRGIP